MGQKMETESKEGKESGEELKGMGRGERGRGRGRGEQGSGKEGTIPCFCSEQANPTNGAENGNK